ncbi:MAG: hypothetical protein ACU4EQ_02135 [Candidatus Nitrosoglobus sp.]|jgi:hypothetical protein
MPWWLGQSIMDMAPYINDTQAGELHDWRNILGDFGILKYDHSIAALVNLIGEGLILLSFVWCSGILYRQYHSLAR